MTTTLTATPAEDQSVMPRPSTTFSLRARAEAASVVLALLAWLVVVTHQFGGRDAGATTLGLLLTIPALTLTKPWTLSRRHLLAIVPGVVAAVVMFVSPMRGDGLDETATLLAAGLVFLVVRAWSQRGGRTAVIVIPVLVAGLDQVYQAWIPWSADRDATVKWVGTFYWHNQFGAFCLGIAALGLAIMLRGNGPTRVVAWIAAPLCIAGLVMSGSRACLALFILVVVALAATNLRRPWALLRGALGVGAGLGVAWFMTSMNTSTAGSNVYSGNVESATGNGSARIEYTKMAWTLLKAHPLTGTGADSFGPAGAPLLPGGVGPTTYVHNGVAQFALTGGVALGLSVVGVLIVALVHVVSLRWQEHCGRRGDVVSAAQLGGTVAVGALLGHALVDFDWEHSSLMVLMAVMAGLALAPSVRTSEVLVTASPDRRSALSKAAVAGVALLALVCSGGLDSAAPTGNTSTWWRVSTFGIGGADRLPLGLTPISHCVTVLRASVVGADVDQALDCTATAAKDQPALQVLRAQTLARTERITEAQALIDALVAKDGTQMPILTLAPAQVLLAAGRISEAQRELEVVRAGPLSRTPTGPESIAALERAIGLAKARAHATT